MPKLRSSRALMVRFLRGLAYQKLWRIWTTAIHQIQKKHLNRYSYSASTVLCMTPLCFARQPSWTLKTLTPITKPKRIALHNHTGKMMRKIEIESRVLYMPLSLTRPVRLLWWIPITTNWQARQFCHRSLNVLILEISSGRIPKTLHILLHHNKITCNTYNIYYYCSAR